VFGACLEDVLELGGVGGEECDVEHALRNRLLRRIPIHVQPLPLPRERGQRSAEGWRGSGWVLTWVGVWA
jgi:hypothetical protein